MQLRTASEQLRHPQRREYLDRLRRHPLPGLLAKEALPSDALSQCPPSVRIQARRLRLWCNLAYASRRHVARRLDHFRLRSPVPRAA